MNPSATTAYLVPQPPDPPTLAELQSLDPRVNAAAWDRAFRILWDMALRLLSTRLLVGAQHEQNRQDIAAQAIEQVTRGVIEKRTNSFNQLTTFDDVCGMTHRIVRARVADFFRHQGRHPEQLTDEIPESDAASAGAESDSALMREEMEALIAKLPPPQPEVFHEHYILGRTAAEIAEDRQLSRNTVLSHLHRGKKTLRGWLADDAQPPAAETRSFPA